jgi:hypothetical protein
MGECADGGAVTHIEDFPSDRRPGTRDPARGGLDSSKPAPGEVDDVLGREPLRKTLG